MGRTSENDYDALKTPVRCFIGYFCLIAFFGCVLLTVHASMESKRLGYESAQLISKKMELLDELHQVENRISHLERYKRIAQLLNEHKPELGPPQHPAIVVKVPGLRETDGLPKAQPFPSENRGWIDRARKQWRAVQEWFRDWLTKLVE